MNSKKNKKRIQAEMDARQAELDAEQAEREKKADFRASLTLFYFVVCLIVTTLATEKHMFTYGQISLIYLPMFFIFIYWLMLRIKDSDNKHGKLGNIVGITLCIVIIVLTLIGGIASWLGLM